MELSNWAPEHSDALRELIAKGLSFSEAAQAINSRFNTSYTRSAALGRARRLRLEADDRQKPSLPTKPVDLHDIAEPCPSASRAAALLWSTPVFKEAKPVKLRCVAIEPRHLSLVDLERGDCRYPYGGDEEGEAITFCGHPCRPGSSYYAPHFHLSRKSGRGVRTCGEHRFAAGGGDRMKNTAVTCVADRLKRLPRRHRIAHLRADRTSAGGLRPPERIIRTAVRGDSGRISRIGQQPNRAAERNRIPLFSRSPSDAESQTPKAVQSRQGKNEGPAICYAMPW